MQGSEKIQRISWFLLVSFDRAKLWGRVILRSRGETRTEKLFVLTISWHCKTANSAKVWTRNPSSENPVWATGYTVCGQQRASSQKAQNQMGFKVDHSPLWLMKNQNFTMQEICEQLCTSRMWSLPHWSEFQETQEQPMCQGKLPKPQICGMEQSTAFEHVQGQEPFHSKLWCKCHWALDCNWHSMNVQIQCRKIAWIQQNVSKLILVCCNWKMQHS